ncbi:MAG TPA: 3D domain-containing protein [Gemmatimonadaceae bacterium]|nr:3D domain-containing protein [Gemmatimonadaceae bacterium]
MNRRAMMLAAVGGCLAGAGCRSDDGPIRLAPVVVTSDYHVPGVMVRGASRSWWKLASTPVRYGDPVPVKLTMYCLQGTTRRGRYVRAGIVATDPRFFPLARYLELYSGESYLGRFLIDDTGKRIRGNRIDVWTSSCADARRFGIRPGTAVLVHPAPLNDVRQAGSARAENR